MQPTQVLWQTQADLMAADTTYLANATGMKVYLANAPFTPSLALNVSDLSPATFTGSAALIAGTGAQPTFRDPLDGLYKIRIKEPAGGWSWVCTADPVATETIYGWYITDNAGTTLLGSGLLDTPVPIAKAGDGLQVPYITLAFSSLYPN